MHRLLPGPPGEISVDDAYAAPLGTNADRPWVGLCMVHSLDGSTVVDGTSAELSNATDSAVLRRLREIADVIVVGASTVRREGYHPPRRTDQRIGVVTATGDVDTTAPLFTSGAGFLVTTTATPVPDGVDTLRTHGARVDLREALTRLHEVCHEPRFVQAEGGAVLNGALLDGDLLDEINVTTSPLTVGGEGPRLASGAGDHAHRYELAQLTVDDESFTYARWRRAAK